MTPDLATLQKLLPLSRSSCHSPDALATLQKLLPLSRSSCHSPEALATLQRLLPLSRSSCHSPEALATLQKLLPLSRSSCHSPEALATLQKLLPMSKCYLCNLYTASPCQLQPPVSFQPVLLQNIDSYEVNILGTGVIWNPTEKFTFNMQVICQLLLHCFLLLYCILVQIITITSA